MFKLARLRLILSFFNLRRFVIVLDQFSPRCEQEVPTFARKFGRLASEASVKNDQTSLGQRRNASYRTASNYFED
jgi:hypothetical protein